MASLTRRVVLVATLVLISVGNLVYSKSLCLGLGNSQTEKLCRAIRKKSTCIKTPAFDSRNIWHSDQTVRVKDEQTLRSKSGLPIGVTGLNYRGSLCALSAKVQVPSQARSRWGAFAALRGGPTAATSMQGSTNPDVKMGTSSCQISKGFPTSCTMRVVAPQGLNLHPDFKQNSLTVDFFTTEGKSIKSWMDNQRLYNWGAPATTYVDDSDRNGLRESHWLIYAHIHSHSYPPCIYHLLYCLLQIQRIPGNGWIQPV
jgi:hypothetical protein